MEGEKEQFQKAIEFIQEHSFQRFDHDRTYLSASTVTKLYVVKTEARARWMQKTGTG